MTNLEKVQRLTLIMELPIYDGKKMGLYKCECGTEKLYPITEVVSMRKTACGCRRFGEANQWGKRHGLRSHPVYNVWKLMRDRCLNDQCSNYENYGARGIKICDEWLNLTVFVNWCESNGYQKGLQLDRRDNNGNYEPSNCHFITHKANANNTRRSRFLEHNGKRQTLQQWADEVGIHSGVIKRRLDVYGYSIEAALTKPVKFK